MGRSPSSRCYPDSLQRRAYPRLLYLFGLLVPIHSTNNSTTPPVPSVPALNPARPRSLRVAVKIQTPPKPTPHNPTRLPATTIQPSPRPPPPAAATRSFSSPRPAARHGVAFGSDVQHNYSFGRTPPPKHRPNPALVAIKWGLYGRCVPAAAGDERHPDHHGGFPRAASAAPERRGTRCACHAARHLPRWGGWGPGLVLGSGHGRWWSGSLR